MTPTLMLKLEHQCRLLMYRRWQWQTLREVRHSWKFIDNCRSWERSSGKQKCAREYWRFNQHARTPFTCHFSIYWSCGQKGSSLASCGGESQGRVMTPKLHGEHKTEHNQKNFTELWKQTCVCAVNIWLFAVKIWQWHLISFRMETPVEFLKTLTEVAIHGFLSRHRVKFLWIQFTDDFHFETSCIRCLF